MKIVGKKKREKKKITNKQTEKNTNRSKTKAWSAFSDFIFAVVASLDTLTHRKEFRANSILLRGRNRQHTSSLETDKYIVECKRVEQRILASGVGYVSCT